MVCITRRSAVQIRFPPLKSLILKRIGLFYFYFFYTYAKRTPTGRGINGRRKIKSIFISQFKLAKILTFQIKLFSWSNKQTPTMSRITFTFGAAFFGYMSIIIPNCFASMRKIIATTSNCPTPRIVS